MKSTAASTLRSPKLLQPPHAHHHHHSAPLQLPGLPRFHPANYPHAPDRAPSPCLNSVQQQQSQSSRGYPASSDPQRPHHHPRDLLALSLSRPPSRQNSPKPKPKSPRLAPMLGSPGPVTPLDLEREREGYFSAAGGGGGGRDGAGAAAKRGGAK